MPETKTAHEELLEKYQALPDQLAAAVSGLSEEQLDLTGGPDQWSIRQIVHHLADGQTMWSVCMRMAIGAPGAAMQLDWYPGNDAWSERMAFAERSIEPGLALLRGFHNEIVELLTVMPEAWEQEVVIGVPGRGDEQAYSVARIMEFTGEHFVEHLGEIAAIKHNHGL
jgi:uncharacterized damage-inducible protein DinB